LKVRSLARTSAAVVAPTASMSASLTCDCSMRSSGPYSVFRNASPLNRVLFLNPAAPFFAAPACDRERAHAGASAATSTTTTLHNRSVNLICSVRSNCCLQLLQWLRHCTDVHDQLDLHHQQQTCSGHLQLLRLIN
jgi:hypothetical protein